MKIRAVIFDMFETLITHYNSPLYFGTQMAADAGITDAEFQKLWRPTEYDRTVGNMTLEETLEMILRENGCYSEDILRKIAGKRIAAKEECFRNLHPEIIPMLTGLRESGMLVGLISNCFSEEAKVIWESVLAPCFDEICLSYELGMQKPEERIFHYCMEKLGVSPEECLYIGDGGSYELETAQRLGMNAMQAVWYLREGTTQPTGRKPEFEQLERPLEVLNYL